MYQQPPDASLTTASSNSEVSPLPDVSLRQRGQLDSHLWIQLAQAEGQKAADGICQQFTTISQNIDWSQPCWNRLAIASLLLSFPTGVSVAAFQVLAQPPQPNCDQSQYFQADLAKLQCLRQAMQSSEHQAILQALQQLQNWPSDSPVYGLSQRLLEDWSVVALSLARREFEAGQWNKAVQLASAIPAQLSLGSRAQTELNFWKTVRDQGQVAYDLALGALEKQDWQTARGHAETLAQLSNDYWRQQGLKELPQQIELARQEQIELARQAQQPSAEDEGQWTAFLHNLPGAREQQLPQRSPGATAGSRRRSRFSMPVVVSLERLMVAEPKPASPEFSQSA